MSINTKIILCVAAVFVLASAVVFWRVASQEEQIVQTPLEKIHIHALFQVYVDGVLQDFSGLEYMNIKPCSEEPEAYDPAEEQYEKAHLHDYIGEVVHVHRRTATWGDLFQNIDVSFPGTLTAYEDGVLVEDIMSREIKADTRVLILSGDSADAESKLAAMPAVDLIREVENNSESCGD